MEAPTTKSGRAFCLTARVNIASGQAFAACPNDTPESKRSGKRLPRSGTMPPKKAKANDNATRTNRTQTALGNHPRPDHNQGAVLRNDHGAECRASIPRALPSRHEAAGSCYVGEPSAGRGIAPENRGGVYVAYTVWPGVLWAAVRTGPGPWAHTLRGTMPHDTGGDRPAAPAAVVRSITSCESQPLDDRSHTQ